MAKKEEEKYQSTMFDCLAVTACQVFPFTECSLGHIKGMAQVVLNDQFMVRGLRIMEGENGLFVGYPPDPFYKGEEYRSICNPICRQLREHIENCVLEKYKATQLRVWSVKFGQPDEHPNDQINLSISINVTECTREEAIKTAKSVLRREYGAFADKVQVLSAE